MKPQFLLFLLSFILPASVVFSQQSTGSWQSQLFVEGGVEYGGDEILTVFFVDGADQTMLAGQGAYIALGGDFMMPLYPAFSLRATLGFKYSTTAADNYNIMLTRFPINVIPFWHASEDIRLGVGLTTHSAVRFKGDGLIPDVDFSSSVGPRLELGYKWFALTYSMVEYSDDVKQSFSANSIGISVSAPLRLP